MKSSLLALMATLFLCLPAWARDAVRDEAGVLDASTRQQVQGVADEIERTAGKQLLVVTVKQVDGTASAHAHKIFAEEKLNGMLIYIAPSQHELGLLPGRSTEAIFPRSVTGPIRDAMKAQFRNQDFNGGVLTGAQRVRDVFVTSPKTVTTAPSQRTGERTRERAASGGGFSWLPLLLLGGGAFLLFRMMSRSRSRGGYDSGGYGQPGYGQPGYGQPGYGPNPGSGGGGFMSSLLGGVGGALLGNAVYDHFRHDGQTSDAGGSYDAGGSSDASWTSDDSGSAGGGDFGSFDSGGGGGDFGGGGDNGW